jgi:hypothetical protein
LSGKAISRHQPILTLIFEGKRNTAANGGLSESRSGARITETENHSRLIGWVSLKAVNFETWTAELSAVMVVVAGNGLLRADGHHNRSSSYKSEGDGDKC